MQASVGRSGVLARLCAWCTGGVAVACPLLWKACIRVRAGWRIRRSALIVEPRAACRLKGDLRAVRQWQAFGRTARCADRIPQWQRRGAGTAGRCDDRQEGGGPGGRRGEDLGGARGGRDQVSGVRWSRASGGVRGGPVGNCRRGGEGGGGREVGEWPERWVCVAEFVMWESNLGGSAAVMPMRRPQPPAQPPPAASPVVSSPLRRGRLEGGHLTPRRRFHDQRSLDFIGTTRRSLTKSESDT